MSDMYKEYTLLEKFDILGQGLVYFWDLLLYWIDLIQAGYNEQHKKCFFTTRMVIIFIMP